MLNYRELELNYGADLLRKVRHLENLSKKHGRFCSHLHFNLQCKRSEVTPRYLKIQGKWESDEEKRVIKRAEKALLNIKIRDTVKKRDYLRSAVENLKGEIKSVVPNELYEDVFRINDERKQREQVRSIERQRDKYYKLKYDQGYAEYQNDITRTTRPSHSAIDKRKWVAKRKFCRRVQASELLTREFSMMSLLQLPSKLVNTCHDFINLPTN